MVVVEVRAVQCAAACVQVLLLSCLQCCCAADAACVRTLDIGAFARFNALLPPLLSRPLQRFQVETPLALRVDPPLLQHARIALAAVRPCRRRRRLRPIFYDAKGQPHLTEALLRLPIMEGMQRVVVPAQQQQQQRRRSESVGGELCRVVIGALMVCIRERSLQALE